MKYYLISFCLFIFISTNALAQEAPCFTYFIDVRIDRFTRAPLISNPGDELELIFSLRQDLIDSNRYLHHVLGSSEFGPIPESYFHHPQNVWGLPVPIAHLVISLITETVRDGYAKLRDALEDIGDTRQQCLLLGKIPDIFIEVQIIEAENININITPLIRGTLRSDAFDFGFYTY